MGIGGKAVWKTVVIIGLAAQTAAAQENLHGNSVQPALIHDLAGVTPGTLAAAKAETERVFAAAGVALAWIDCRADDVKPGRPQPCPPRPDGTIIARIAPAPLDYIDPSALGYALNVGDQGVYATVSLLRVRQCVANQTNSSANLEQVLGHAIAHELGHLLPGEQSHARAGLMQAGWGHKVLDDISKGRLFFSDGEARRIREAVARRTRHAARMPAPPS